MKTLLLFILLVTSSLTVYAQAQPAKRNRLTEAQTEPLKFILELKLAELQAKSFALDPENNRDKADAAGRVQLMYARAVRDTALLDALVSDLASDYASMKEQVRSAPQASQVAEQTNVQLQFLVIQQNARIISLLEQLIRKR